MNKSFHTRAIVLATLIVVCPATGFAQEASSTTANDMALAGTAQPAREDNDFPWGLLGLLGLAGLLGRKRDDKHVHVDRTGTTNNRP